VYLYGHLAKKYGEVFRFDITVPGDAARAMAANFKEFYKDFKDNYYRVIVGDRSTGLELDKDSLHFRVGKNDVHFIPIVAGSKGGGGGVVKAIIGVVIIAAAIVIGPAAYWAIGLGVSFLAAGVAAMLTKPPKINSFDTLEQPDARSSFVFNGPTNKSKQGAAVPIVFGRMRTGSVIISAGISIEKIL
jgi:predicted phage tail protein